ncbi:PLP-dependent transferase [Thelephora terrestris]|uniref:PLP-dependent transferase n=1 Tax=Thelephora terrestris TaxID=56493 RepID=A0A9P6L4R3_9AGAM|nr:PLP-dependent transferase [Thelephora terrestris]
MSTGGLPKSIDLSHHLSDVANARLPSPLKLLAKYAYTPGMIPLAGGMPNPSYFPFSAIHVDALVTNSFAPISLERRQSGTFSWLWNMFGSKEKTVPFAVKKYPDHPGDIDLATTLQYGTAEGSIQLREICQAFTERVYQPAYEDWKVLLHTGNTDGWSRIVTTFTNHGDWILAEEWTYPSALSTVQPWGIKAAPVTVDGEGLSAVDLRKILAGWDEAERGGKRPHVLYTIPVGQNPTGGTLSAQRKQEVYNICVEFDVIIVEDDPYYFLQMPHYVPKETRKTSASPFDTDEDNYLRKLVPSYLKFDWQGRVIRLDTFSKTIAPGVRLGWFTCNPTFAENLLRQGQTSTQAPCGLGQAMVAQLLITWKPDGYIRWLRGLGQQYTDRRDHFIDLLRAKFHTLTSVSEHNFWKGCTVYDAYLETGSPSEKTGAFEKVKCFSFVAPSAGMFIWLKFYFDSHPKFGKKSVETLEMHLWEELAKAEVLVAPGWMFSADQENTPDGKYEGHYRISFSTATFSDMKRGVDIIAEVMKSFLHDD